MDREQMEARLAHLQAQYQRTRQETERLSRALVMLEGGIAELQFVLAQDAEADEESDDAE